MVNICYQTTGEPNNPAIMLIAGLGEQIFSWPEGFCDMLAKVGFYVIRFDNRDAGRSTKMDSKGIPNLGTTWEAYFKGEPINPPYTLADMADDAVNLLNKLGIPKANICGFSLGGMIAQNMAFKHAKRMVGMICMGSSTGELHLPPPTADAQAAMATPPPQTKDKYIAHMVSVFRVFSAGSKLYDPECRSETAAQSYGHLYAPGFMRQSMAMLADGSRRDRLDEVQIPTLVLHGALDPVARPEHGHAIADAVDKSRIIIFPEWGHGLDYPELWPDLIKAILSMQ